MVLPESMNAAVLNGVIDVATEPGPVAAHA
jgi:hypothetical protein